MPGALTLLTLAAPTAAAATPAPNQVKQGKQLKAWPKLSDRDNAKLNTMFRSLGRKKQKPEMVTRLERKTVAIGLGACHRLLRRFSDKPAGNFNGSLERILDQMLKPEHADLVAKYFKHKSVAGRRYVIRKLQTFRAKQHAKLFEAALKDKDKEVVFHANLGLARVTMNKKALEFLFKRCIDDWRIIGKDVGEALQDIRGGEAMMWLQKRIRDEGQLERIIGLRWMRSLATKEFVGYIGKFLDDDDAVTKKEAINALRVVVDGKEPLPLQKITVFQLSQLKKKWKARI